MSRVEYEKGTLVKGKITYSFLTSTREPLFKIIITQVTFDSSGLSVHLDG